MRRATNIRRSFCRPFPHLDIVVWVPRTEVNLRRRQRRYIDANQLCPLPDIDFAAPTFADPSVFYLSSNRHGMGCHRNCSSECPGIARVFFASDELTDCTHVVLPRNVLGATPVSIGKLDYGLGRVVWRSAPANLPSSSSRAKSSKMSATGH